jgi:glutaminyl-tRNA synthetase
MSGSDSRNEADPGPPSPATRSRGTDFIRQIIQGDLARGTTGGRVVTRFPPEPNGYLHIGHAKSVVLNFGIASEHEGGRCHLRFDDTNPTTEDIRYVKAIQEDVRWLGYDWGEHLYFASDYFEEMYGLAEGLIRKGLAYVDSQSEEEIREGRGTVTRPGVEGPYRERSVEENLDLFRRMRAGEFSDGEHVLRARIDMASPNMLMRDPVLYRIRHTEHYRTDDEWCIYPLYDYAHPLGDALEDVTHSLCTLEFENNRELYDWVVEHTAVETRPRQYEFARLNLDYTVMSKRKLLRLVQDGVVEGWDDPRMPTLAGLRRRGVTPEAIRNFCEMIGVAKADSRVDMAKLEYAIRDDLNQKAPRVLCVLRPLRVVLTNWPEGEVDRLEAPYFPRDVPREGARTLPFSGELFIDRDDFKEDPPRGFRRLVPGGEVRLRYGYVIRCEEVVKDEEGRVVELRCTYDPDTRGGTTPDGRRVKGTIQWVSAPHAVKCRVRLYDRLFAVPDPDGAAARGETGNADQDSFGNGEDEGAGVAGTSKGRHGDFRDFLNPDSLQVVESALIEPSVAGDPDGVRYQFERIGYFWRDPVDSTAELPVFNRIVTLRDTWEKVAAKPAAGPAKEEAGPKERLEGAAARPSEGEEVGDRVRTGEAGPPPELPPEVRARVEELEDRYALERVDAEILAREPELERFYRGAVDAYSREAGALEGRSGDDGGPPGAASVANWIIHELPPHQGDRPVDALPFGPSELARLVALVDRGVLSSTGGREVLETLASEGGDPRAILEERDLAQVSDPEVLGPVVTRVLEAHPDKVSGYISGKKGLLGFFVGQVMRETRGRANPELAKRMLEEALGG